MTNILGRLIDLVLFYAVALLSNFFFCEMYKTFCAFYSKDKSWRIGYRFPKRIPSIVKVKKGLWSEKLLKRTYDVRYNLFRYSIRLRWKNSLFQSKYTFTWSDFWKCGKINSYYLMNFSFRLKIWSITNLNDDKHSRI